MSSEVCQLCLEALTPLAEQCAKAQETDSPLFLATRHFLKVDGARGRSRLSPEEGTLPLVQTGGDRLVSAVPSGATSGQVSASVPCS